MKTSHNILFADARTLDDISDHTIDLVVTSPPYPMIKMWDALFSSFSAEIATALTEEQGVTAFELMHIELDRVWQALERVVKASGFVCINIGDATRTLGQQFQLYPNHSRIISGLMRYGFQPLPLIIWKKSTNAPNKFMGSGMLPAGAYVTLEHEYILIFRKGGKREFRSPEQKQQRKESALFWEERNCWFSDRWDLSGVRQKMSKENLRERNAAYPFELAHRLINMYSVKGDTILDPFLGTGTTLTAAIASARNSIGIEYDQNFGDLITHNIQQCAELANQTIEQRLAAHRLFVQTRQAAGKSLKYHHSIYDFPVITRQETAIEFNNVKTIDSDDLQKIKVSYEPMPPNTSHQ